MSPVLAFHGIGKGMRKCLKECGVQAKETDSNQSKLGGKCPRVVPITQLGSKGLEPGTRHDMSGSKASLFSPLILELHFPSSLLLLAHLSCFFLCRDDFPASLAHDPNVAFPFLFMFFQFKCLQ